MQTLSVGSLPLNPRPLQYSPQLSSSPTNGVVMVTRSRHRSECALVGSGAGGVELCIVEPWLSPSLAHYCLLLFSLPLRSARRDRSGMTCFIGQQLSWDLLIARFRGASSFSTSTSLQTIRSSRLRSASPQRSTTQTSMHRVAFVLTF